ncbi:Kelch repeat-containing protein [Chloroflexus sp.]|uniref:Kelch repeat-containing protein n=1 Tax=Chloroflexus sp. TaxID=1904827 RepID=UPI00261CCB55|nr:LuxR C-terminal-related transcriptional regulator [uncultured Chloroflexus sp.]
MTNESPISDREREILRLVATGATNQQIALALNISVNTVKVHLRNIFAKIGVESRTEATVYAIRAGIVTVGETGLVEAGTKEISLESESNVTIETGSDTPSAQQPFAEPEAAPPDPLPASATEPFIRPASTSEPLAPPVSATESATVNSVSSLPPAPITPPASSPTRFIPWVIGLIGLVAVVLIFVLSTRATDTPSPAVSATQPAFAGTEQRWSTRQPLSEPRDDFALTGYDLERRLYVIGGRRNGITTATVDRYDPETNRWVSLTDKPTAVSHARAITLRGQIFVPGGEDNAGAVIDRLEIYDPREQRWFSGAPLPAPRSRYALVAWEGQLYLIGGWDGTSIRSEVFIYDPLLDRWVEGPPLPQPRRYAGAAIVGGRLYLVGGEGINGPLRDSAWLEPGNTPDRRWIATAPLPQPIARPAAVGLSSALVVFDSERREGLSYDIAADAWSRSPLPPEAYVFPDAVLVESSIYFMGDTRAQGMLSEYRALYIIFIPGQ